MMMAETLAPKKKGGRVYRWEHARIFGTDAGFVMMDRTCHVQCGSVVRARWFFWWLRFGWHWSAARHQGYTVSRRAAEEMVEQIVVGPQDELHPDRPVWAA